MLIRADQRYGIVGSSAALRQAVEAAARAAPARSPVLLLGERGTGKELFARMIHAQSGRTGELVAVNCATLHPDRAAAQLFGHRRGSFTGAERDRDGQVRAARRGTLFLDEIGELPLDVQAGLLRLLQEGTVQPVGEEREQAVDVRVIAATHRDLDRMVREGHFRADLYDRLRMLLIRLPPLRERKEDLVGLATRWLEQGADLRGLGVRLGSEAGAVLRAYDWPGNVRELQGVLLRAATARGAPGALTARDLRRALGEAGAPGGGLPSAEAVLAGLEPGRVYSAAELAVRIGASSGTVKRRVRAWVAAGLLVPRGEGRGRAYVRPGSAEERSSLQATSGVEARLLLALAELGEAASGALAARLGVGKATVKRAVVRLRAEGRVVVRGVGSGSRIALAEGAQPAGRAALAREVGPPELGGRAQVREAGQVETATSAARPAPGGDAAGRAPGGRAGARPQAPPAPPARGSASSSEGLAAEQEALALRLAAGVGILRAQALAEALGRTVRTAERVLARLVEAGRLRTVGHARARRYVLPTVAAPVPVRTPRATPRARPARQPARPRPSLTLLGRRRSTEQLRLALALAARPAGATADQVAARAGLAEREALGLLGDLVASGLLLRSVGEPSVYRLSAPEGGG